MAHLKALETRGDDERRYRWKPYLVKRLYRLGYSKEDIIQLFEFIDWVMALPQELEQAWWNEVWKMEEERKVRYVSSVERIGIEKGMQQGMQQGTIRLLSRLISRRFRVSSDSLRPIFAGMNTGQLEELGSGHATGILVRQS